ncbi:hypothetical protein [Sulfurimonas autotrophica]|nr:hypothetical protein [Sulfurimonas autotrophica]
MAIVITLGIYINQGLKPLDSEISTALLAIFKFWFVLSWSFALLIILFRSLKYIFNKCIGSYKFNLLTCPKEDKKEQTREIIVNIGYGDLLKVWRKWFMLIIWIVAAQMILALVIMKLFSSYENIFDWFNIYLLYIFILIAGYFSFIALNIKCKKVRITKC